jgi:hypothetical protein
MDALVAAVMNQQAALTQGTVQIGVLRKVLDIEAQQGVDLARMMQQAAGLGRAVDFQA